MARVRRVIRGGLVLMLVAAALPGSSLAGGAVTRQGGGGAPDIDTQDSVLTEQQAAGFALKEQAADDIDAALRGGTSGGAQPSRSRPAPNLICTESCDGGGRTPPAAIKLATRARQQAKWYWCGPASAQVVINHSRGYVFGNLNGENPDTNFLKQSTLAKLLGTNDDSGTTGSALANVLNRDDTVQKPFIQWAYAYRDSGTKSELFDKVLTDVYVYSMPLVMGVAPHLPGATLTLASWPNETQAHHYIVLSGYNGLSWSSSVISYEDSAGGYNGRTGTFTDSLVTIWSVNRDNQGKVIW